MEEDKFRATKTIKQEAYMASDNYIRRMILPLQSAGKNIAAAAAVPYDRLSIRLRELRGLTGVTVSYSSDVARAEIIKRSDGWMYGDWLKVLVPLDACYLDIEKPIAAQTDEVKSAVLGEVSLRMLFVDEVNSILGSPEEKTPQNAAENGYSLASFFEEKRRFLLDFPTCTDFINYLNEKGRNHSSDMTSSYLYLTGVKGLRYSDEKGSRVLLFNARDDIEVSDINTEK